jgi:hypothetical protein
MSDYCAIFCRRADYQLATELVKLVFQTPAVELTGEEFNWRKITITTRGSILILKSKVGVKSGDDFSRIVQGTLHHCWRLETGRSADKEHVLNAIRACKMVIGVGAYPGLSQAAGHFDCIFGLTRALQGLILNGVGVVDARGSVLLAGQRKSRSLS